MAVTIHWNGECKDYDADRPAAEYIKDIAKVPHGCLDSLTSEHYYIASQPVPGGVHVLHLSSAGEHSMHIMQVRTPWATQPSGHEQAKLATLVMPAVLIAAVWNCLNQ